MKRNRYDRISDKMLARIERVTNRMTREFKGTVPFDKEPVSEDKQLAEYMNMNTQMMDERMQRDGAEATNMWIENMENLKNKRGWI